MQGKLAVAESFSQDTITGADVAVGESLIENLCNS